MNTTSTIHHRTPLINASTSPICKIMAAEDPTLKSSSSQSPSLSQLPPSPPDDPSQIPQSNPSKIPIRPQKIRKLSSPEEQIKTQTTIADADASKSVIPSTTTTKNRRRNPETPKLTKPLSSPGEISAALNHLRSTDPLLASLIDNHPPPTFDTHQPPFLALSKSILYQQLAYKAGTSIYTRFVTLCGGENGVVPETVLSLTSQQLKQIGVSGRKASYLFDLANKFKNGILSDDTIVKMDDRSVFTMLSMVKGIGSWSVHMFMIFSLHRPDVLPVSDLGVRKGVQLLYSLDELPRPSQMEQLCVNWRPYRSVGAWYMWRFVEGKGGQVGGVTGDGLENGGFPGHQQVGQSEQAQQQQQQHQHQSQLLEPITSIGNLGMDRDFLDRYFQRP